MYKTSILKRFTPALVLLAVVAIALASCNQTAKETQAAEEATEENSAVAENVAQEASEEATPQPEYVGNYISDYDSSELHITPREDGQFDILIDLFRLTSIDDAIGSLADDGLHFSATDAGGGIIEGTIEVNDTAANLIFTHSTWMYIEDGDSYEFRRVNP